MNNPFDDILPDPVSTSVISKRSGKNPFDDIIPDPVPGNKATKEPNPFDDIIPDTPQGNPFDDIIPDTPKKGIVSMAKDFLSEGFVKPGKTFLGGMDKAAASTADLLDFYTNKIADFGVNHPVLSTMSPVAGILGNLKKRGKLKDNIFTYLRDNWSTLGDKLQSEGVSDGLVKEIYSGLGKATWDVPVKYLGPGKFLKTATLPLVGAAEGYKEGGLKGGAIGAAEGAAMHGVIKGLNALPVKIKLPAAFTVGATTTPGTTEQKVAGGAIFAGLSAPGKSPTMGEFKETQKAYNPVVRAWADKGEGLYQDYINRFHSIENIGTKAREAGAKIAPGEDPKLRARSYLGLGPKVKSVLEDKTYRLTPEGGIEITGEGLKPILDSYEKVSPEPIRKMREKDLNDYLIARRTVEDLQRPKSEWNKENIVTPEQVKISQDTIVSLTAKYKGDISHMDQAATRLYDYQRRVLHLLVDSGNMSEDMYKATLSRNPHYIPFDRIMPETEMSGVAPVSKNRFTGARSPVKRIKGSELEIHDPIESMIKNTYRIMDISERNNVARSVAKLSDVLPDDISPVEVPIIPLAKAKLKAQIDPVLQGELTSLIKDLKGEYSRRLKLGGQKLGYFQPPRKIASRFATREDVIAHELGHYTDRLYGLQEKFLGDKVINKELQQLADLRYEGANPTEGYKHYVRRGGEKIAALMDAYITKPFILDEVAPTAKEALTTLIGQNKELQPLLKIRPSMVAQYEKATETIWGQSPFKPKGDVIEYYDNGKKSYIKVTPNLYQAMTGLNETSSNLLTKILSTPANWLRTGATITPEFMGRNYLRDQMGAAMQTKLGFKPVVDSVGAIADILGKSDIYYDWLRSGGAYSGITELSRTNLKKMVGDLQKMPFNEKLKDWKTFNPITRAQDLSQLFEQATRLGIYKKAVGKGMTSIEAGFESREGTLDFARRGAKMKEINSSIAFFNAGIQSLDKSIRVAKEDPAGLTVKGIAMITIPSLLLYLQNRKDPEYQEIPRWKRDLFFIFKVKNTWVTIPKPFTYGQIFGTIPERFFEYLDTKDPTAFNNLGKTIYDALSPVYGDPAGGLIGTAMKPFVENYTNKSFFTGRPIVPMSKEKALPEYQYSKNTSETAKELGKISKTSPLQIENVIQGYTGGSGRYALKAADSLINTAKRAFGQEVKPKVPAELTDMPLVKGFTVGKPYGTGSESVKTFYENREALKQSYTTYRQLLLDGNSEEARKIKTQYPFLKYSSAFDRYAEIISAYSDRIDRIMSSTKYTDDKKREMIATYEKRITDYARKANNLLKKK